MKSDFRFRPATAADAHLVAAIDLPAARRRTPIAPRWSPYCSISA